LISIFIISIVFNTLSIGQEYSPIILEKFVKVYFQEKEIPKYNEADIEKAFQEHSVTKQEYQSARDLKNEKKALYRQNENLSSLEIRLAEIEENSQQKHDSTLIELCNNSKLDILSYKEIKYKYQHDLKFQRSLKSIFANHINTLNNE
jgi:hypothetical protein